MLGINRELLQDRITKLGWSIKKALTTPVLPRGIKKTNIILEYNGEAHPIGTWEKLLGFKPETVRNRIKLGWNIEEALTIPPEQTRKQH